MAQARGARAHRCGARRHSAANTTLTFGGIGKGSILLWHAKLESGRLLGSGLLRRRCRSLVRAILPAGYMMELLGFSLEAAVASYVLFPVQVRDQKISIQSSSMLRVWYYS